MRIKKLMITLLLSVILIVSSALPVSAQNNQTASILINGEILEKAAQIIDNQIYVPLDALQNKLGNNLQYTYQDGKVSINTGDAAVQQAVQKVSQSVVGIIGNISESSTSYYDYGSVLVFGSGVVYRSDGYIITNAHVVEDMENIVVVLSNGKAYSARLKAIDEKCDLALIKIDKGRLKPVVWADPSSITEGTTVMAIGTPLSFSLRNSVTLGIISGLNRTIDNTYRFIQSDAAINSGNSGGPLINMKGEVIGINSVKYRGVGIEGLSFSIPVDTVLYAMDHFFKYGRIIRPYLGAELEEGVAARYGLPSSEGLTISKIYDGSPAEKAGLLEDDVIVEMNGVKLTTIIDYNEETKKYMPGDTVIFKVIRDEETIEVSVKFDEEKL